MAVTHLHHDTDPLDDLITKIDDLIASTIPSVTLAAARRMANETGVHRYQSEIDSLLEQRKTNVDLQLAAKHRLNVAREALADATSEAEWSLSDRFKVRGNKTFLVVDETGKAIPDDDQQSFDAAARKEWTKRVAGSTSQVREAAAAVANAEDHLAEVEANLGHIDKALSAVKSAMTGAVAELETVRLALITRKDI